MNSLLSIIIPIYNHEESLSSVLLSIQKQAFRQLEIIIVDDGSYPPVDRKNYAAGDISITWIRQENKGAPAARNAGLAKATGEYVIWWDADIIAEPHMLEKMVRALEQHKEASFAYSNFYFGNKKMPARAFDSAALQAQNYINSATLVRRTDAPKWDESLTRFQDWDLWLSMAEQGKQGVWIDDYLYRAIPHKGGMSSWLPSFAYRAPWKYLPVIKKKVEAYEEAKEIIKKKHGI